MRKQIDGLAALVQTQFGQEMDETSLYIKKVSCMIKNLAPH